MTRSDSNLSLIERTIQSINKYEEKIRPSVLNGNYRKMEKYNYIQRVFLNEVGDIEERMETIHFLIKNYKGVDLNFRTKCGLNCFHIFLVCLYFLPEYDNDNSINAFIKLLNFGYLPSLLVFTFFKTYSLLDTLFFLQYKSSSIISKSFFPKEIRSHLRCKQLSPNAYDKLHIALLCHNEKYMKVRDIIHPIHNLTIYNLIEKIENNELLLTFVKVRYNLAHNTSISDIKNHILASLSTIKNVEEPKEEDIPIDTPLSDKNKKFLNPQLIPNSSLHIDNYFRAIEDFKFHDTYLPLLIKNRENPYTRKELSRDFIDKLYLDCDQKYILPISDLLDRIKHFPFIFESVQNLDQRAQIKSHTSFIESFFNINHPYNQIHKIIKMKQYEIKYFSYVLLEETNIFPKFNKLYETPTQEEFVKILLYYAKSKFKYLNVLFFFFEEISHDISAYHHVESFIDDSDEHYHDIIDIYQSRFNINNHVFLAKFTKNMLKIHLFKKSFSGL